MKRCATDFEAMRGLGAARPRRVGQAGAPTRQAPRRRQMKNSRDLESDLIEVASGTRTHIQQLSMRAMQTPEDSEVSLGARRQETLWRAWLPLCAQ